MVADQFLRPSAIFPLLSSLLPPSRALSPPLAMTDKNLAKKTSTDSFAAEDQPTPTSALHHRTNNGLGIISTLFLAANSVGVIYGGTSLTPATRLAFPWASTDIRSALLSRTRHPRDKFFLSRYRN